MVNVDAFKAHMAGLIKPKDEPAAAPPGDEPDEGGDGLSPGDQAMKAIKAGDSAALEEAIKRCVGSNY